MKTTKQEIKIILLWFIVALATFYIGLRVFGVWHDEWSGYNTGTKTTISDGVCNIAVVPIIGDIIPYAGADQDGSWNEMPPSTNPDDALAMLRSAEKDEEILGVFVRIDSNGGSPVASETIANA
ncbi:MAG: hypothetical protein AAB962_01220, partial [Patescibacteria group bacterium]